MTPTEQDKMSNEELKKIINFVINHTLMGTNATLDWRKRDELTKQATELITADRERVALEARLQEVEVSIIELERSDDPRFYSKDEAIRSQRARYTQLKAQQEEVK